MICILKNWIRCAVPKWNSHTNVLNLDTADDGHKRILNLFGKWAIVQYKKAKCLEQFGVIALSDMLRYHIFPSLDCLTNRVRYHNTDPDAIVTSD